jgi:vanillate O-demethylase ferredoxin subunit
MTASTQGTLRVRVARRVREAEGIDSFELVREDGGTLPAFSAGSHIDVHVPGGTVRQYSLCNDAAENNRYRIAVLRDTASRGGSAGMHDAVHEGDVLTISPPRNLFALHESPRSLLLAGGIGVTPILCMAQRLAAIGADFEMHYCARSRERMAFASEIEASPFADRVHLHFDDGDAAQKLDLPALIATPDAGTRIYVCGPQGFIDHVVSTAKARGWPADRVHLEYFGAAPQDHSADDAFDVKIASSGQTYTVPAGQSITQALLAHGVEIMVSCEQGVCGTCITRVLEGTPDHRDLYFTDDEKASGNEFTPCCSRSKTPLLVLDL